MTSPLRSILKRFHRPRHATIVAYIALMLASAVPASAALNVRSADIVDGQVKQADIGNNAVNASKVAANSLTGADIDESTLLATRVSNKLRGNLVVSAPQGPASSPYPLTGDDYNQPAGSSELYLGSLRVAFPPGCDPEAGFRSATVEIFVNGSSVGIGTVTDQGTGSATATSVFLTLGGGFATDDAANRSVAAQVSSSCDQATSTDVPDVTSLRLDVARFR